MLLQRVVEIATVGQPGKHFGAGILAGAFEFLAQLGDLLAGTVHLVGGFRRAFFDVAGIFHHILIQRPQGLHRFPAIDLADEVAQGLGKIGELVSGIGYLQHHVAQYAQDDALDG